MCCVLPQCLGSGLRQAYTVLVEKIATSAEKVKEKKNGLGMKVVFMLTAQLPVVLKQLGWR